MGAAAKACWKLELSTNWRCVGLAVDVHSAECVRSALDTYHVWSVLELCR